MSANNDQLAATVDKGSKIDTNIKSSTLEEHIAVESSKTLVNPQNIYKECFVAVNCSKPDLTHHTSNHEFLCTECNCRFKHKPNYLLHIEKHNRKTEYISNQMFDQNTMSDHCFNSEHANSPKNNEHIIFSESLKTPSTPSENFLNCKECDYMAESPERLQQHISAKHGKLLHNHCSKRGGIKSGCKYTQCKYTFPASKSLESHIVSKHIAGNKFKCSECSYSTMNKDSFQKHQLRHSTDRPFCCPNCTLRFNQKRELKKHISSIHTEKRPFKCPYCYYTGKRKYLLVRHQKVHHSLQA